MFFKQDLLRDAHFPVHINASDDGSEERNCKHDVVDSAVLRLLLREQDADVHDDDLLWQCEEGGDGKVPEFHIAGGEDGGGEVGWDDGEADDEHDEESSVASEAGERSVVQVRAF